LIDISIIISKNIGSEDTNSNKVNVMADCKFGNLFICWKPEVIKNLMSYFTPKKKKKAYGAKTLAKLTSFDEGIAEIENSPMGGMTINEFSNIDTSKQDREIMWLNVSVGTIRLYLEYNHLYLAYTDIVKFDMNLRLRQD